MTFRTFFATLSAGLMLAAGAFVAQTCAAQTAATTAAPSPAGETAFDARMTVPPDWSLDRRADSIMLHSAEPGLDVVITHPPAAADAATAVAAAWAIADPAFNDPMASSTSRGPVSGWDDMVVVYYDPPASEGRASFAAAFRLGNDWTVVTIKASLAVLDRQGAKVQSFTSSFVPINYQPEDFTGRTPHAFDAARIAALRDFIKTGMTRLRIPGAASQDDAGMAAERAAITPVPASADLATDYAQPLLGKIHVVRQGDSVVFDFGPWSTPVGAKADPNVPGGVDYVSTAPSAIEDLVFVPGSDDQGRTLTLSDAQHSYAYHERK